MSFSEIEPARLQFIEREFHDLLGENADPAVVRQIHDALFIQGKSIAVLRNQLGRRRHEMRVIAVTSGKGGVGKTTVSVNLAVALAGCGLRVLLFDADLGMANVHIFAGVTPRATILDLVEGRAALAQILTTGPAGIQIICGASGIAGLADLDLRIIEFLSRELVRLAGNFDILLIDTGAGISGQVMRFLATAHDIIVVATPNLASTLDAYGVMKVSREQRLPGRIHLLINQTNDEAQADAVFERLSGCASRFLEFMPASLGSLRRDAAIEASNQSRRPLVLAKPKNKNTARFTAMAERFVEVEFSSNPPNVSIHTPQHTAAA